MNAITTARTLGKDIQADERYQRLIRASKANDDDLGLQGLMSEYKGWQNKLKKLGVAHEEAEELVPDIHKRLKELHQKIMERDTMIEFSEAKQEVDKFVDFINDIIVGSLNGKNPDTIEQSDPTKEDGCTDDCFSCVSRGKAGCRQVFHGES